MNKASEDESSQLFQNIKDIIVLHPIVPAIKRSGQMEKISLSLIQKGDTPKNVETIIRSKLSI